MRGQLTLTPRLGSALVPKKTSKPTTLGVGPAFQFPRLPSVWATEHHLMKSRKGQKQDNEAFSKGSPPNCDGVAYPPLLPLSPFGALLCIGRRRALPFPPLPNRVVWMTSRGARPSNGTQLSGAAVPPSLPNGEGVSAFFALVGCPCLLLFCPLFVSHLPRGVGMKVLYGMPVRCPGCAGVDANQRQYTRATSERNGTRE